MPLTSINDDDLRRRLQAHNFSVPPITDSSRAVLLKKLVQLDNEKTKKNGPSLGGSTNGTSRRGFPPNLMDYSSAEDDVQSDPPLSKPQRRISTSSRNSTSARVTRSSTRSGSPEVSTRQRAVTPNDQKLTNGHSGRARQLLSHSESEEDSDEDDEEEEVEDEEEDEEDEEEEESEEDEGEYEQRVDMSIQTSPGLETTVDSTPVIVNGGTRFRGHRFASSTPLSPMKTSSYLSTSTGSKNASQFVISSPQLRKQISKDKDSFGSLNEALSSLPNRSTDSSCSSTATYTTSTPGVSNSVVSQAHNHLHPETYKIKESTFCNSHSVSKLIIVLAGIFFIVLAYKYTSLRPSIDVASRIPICAPNQVEHCFDKSEVEHVLSLYKDIISALEEQGVAYECRGTDDVVAPTISRSDLVERIAEKRHISPLEIESYVYTLLDQVTNPRDWGFTVNEDDQLLSVTSPPVYWSCWLWKKGTLLYKYTLSGIVYVAYLALIGGLLYGLKRGFVWYQERKLREHQDVFELVEQVLSILAAQHQLTMREGRPINKSCVAINHIRDQLIPPQERRRKRRLWDKVVRYIRESESRVREDIQHIFGEEHRVWQWIPDIQWSPNLAHMSHPFSPPVSMSTPTSMASSHRPMHTPMHSPMHSQWQGAAFSTLNKNVAAPQIAPTSCLKVRHMFDEQTKKTGPGWTVQVKEEILRRCGTQGAVLHIAVDTESQEGCVYIKALNAEEAGKVFRNLHGQWYRGNLVTVKYLREERYYERFPDAKFSKTPLRTHLGR